MSNHLKKGGCLYSNGMITYGQRRDININNVTTILKHINKYSTESV